MVKAIIFLVFTILSIIGLFYSIKNYQHAETYLHQTEQDVITARANCIEKAQRVVDLGLSNGKTADDYCPIPDNLAYLFK